MKLLTRNTDYGIRAICFISKSGKDVVSVAELVRALKMPKPFLRKILQALNKGGIVRSHKGIGGGFELSVSPDKIRLIDLIESFQGPVEINKCFFKKALCPNRTKCALKKKIDRIEAMVRAELKKITIEDLTRA